MKLCVIRYFVCLNIALIKIFTIYVEHTVMLSYFAESGKQLRNFICLILQYSQGADAIYERLMLLSRPYFGWNNYLCFNVLKLGL